jgi:hypothetical protein
VQLIIRIRSFRRAIKLLVWGGLFVLGMPWYAKMDLVIYKKEKGWQLQQFRQDQALNAFRYANMDFIMLSILVNVFIFWLTLSYDIACQWSRNFRKKVGQFPAWMQLLATVLDSIRYVIPKFHIYGHGRPCQTKFLLNFLLYSGCTNGEEPE